METMTRTKWLLLAIASYCVFQFAIRALPRLAGFPAAVGAR